MVSTPYTRRRAPSRADTDYETNKQKVLHHLGTHYNLRAEQISAFMAAVHHECRYNPNVVGDHGTAFGICQWRFERDTGRRSFLAARPGEDRITAEVDYAMHEMGVARKDGANKAGPRWNAVHDAGRMFRDARSIEQASLAMNHFERFRGYNSPGGQSAARLSTTRSFFSGVASALADFARGVVNGVVELGKGVVNGAASIWERLRGGSPDAQRAPAIEQLPMHDREMNARSNPKYVLGDSIGVGFCEAHALKYKNLAVGGRTIRGAMGQMDMVPPGNSALVFLGTNDACMYRPKDRIQQDVRAFLDKAHAKGIHIAGWVLPGDVKQGNPRDTVAMREAAGWIKETIRDYNRMHIPRKPVKPIEVRGNGFVLADKVHYIGSAYGNMGSYIVTKLMERNQDQDIGAPMPTRTEYAAAQPTSKPVHWYAQGTRPEVPGWGVNTPATKQAPHSVKMADASAGRWWEKRPTIH